MHVPFVDAVASASETATLSSLGRNAVFRQFSHCQKYNYSQKMQHHMHSMMQRPQPPGRCLSVRGHASLAAQPLLRRLVSVRSPALQGSISHSHLQRQAVSAAVDRRSILSVSAASRSEAFGSRFSRDAAKRCGCAGVPVMSCSN